MQFVLEGVLMGIMLSALVGPIFIALTQTAVEKGARAGFTVGSGIWVSDFLIIMICYWFIQYIQKSIENERFMFWMGLGGGLLLITFGLMAFFKKVELNSHKMSHSLKNYAEFWIKGFLVNTVNPFTFVFWIGAISTYIIGRNSTPHQASLFLGAIFLTIVITDVFKVIMAKLIRTKLKVKHLKLLSKIAGIGLFVFGWILIFRTI